MTRDGVLIDGQHRLAAVIESEVTCDFLFCDSFELKGFAYIDTGVSRSAAQRKRIEALGMLSILTTMWNDHLNGTARKTIRQNTSNVRMLGVNVTWNNVLLGDYDRGTKGL